MHVPNETEAQWHRRHLGFALMPDQVGGRALPYYTHVLLYFVSVLLYYTAG